MYVYGWPLLQEVMVARLDKYKPEKYFVVQPFQLIMCTYLYIELEMLQPHSSLSFFASSKSKLQLTRDESKLVKHVHNPSQPVCHNLCTVGLKN